MSMRRHVCIVFLALAMLAWTGMVAVGAAEGTNQAPVAAQGSLASCQQAYARAMEKVGSDGVDAMTMLAKRYRQALEAHKNARQKAGDLDDTIAVVKELERFSQGGALPKATSGDNQALAALQKPFVDGQARIADEKRVKTSRILADYVARLETEKKKLTIAGLLDEALAVDGEIKRIKSSPEFQLAGDSAAADTGAPKPDERADSGTAGSLAAPGRNTATKKPATQTTAPEGIVFKPLTLRQTQFSRLGVLGLSASLGERSSVERNRSRGYYSSTTMRSGASDLYVRLQLRTGSGKPAFSNLTAMVQFFCKTAGKSASMIVPRQFGSAFADLPRVDSNPVSVDLDPKSLSRSVSEYHSYYGGHAYASGEEFYGILVTVVDGVGAVVYQGASGLALNDFCKSATSDFKKYRISQDLRDAEKELESARSAYWASSSDAALRERMNSAQKRVDSLRGQMQ
jgi:hypothetical protein